jgi:hypothetical protein
MAKFAREETKPFNPIDSKMLGALAEIATPEPDQSDFPPEPESISPPAAPAVTAKASPPPRRDRPPAKSTPIPAPVSLPPRPNAEKLNRVVKCLFTESEEQELRNLLNRLRAKSGISLSFSHLMRPFFDLLLQSEDQLGEELANAGLRRPINDKNALAAFERDLAHVIHEALRRTDTKPQGKRI